MNKNILVLLLLFICLPFDLKNENKNKNSDRFVDCMCFVCFGSRLKKQQFRSIDVVVRATLECGMASKRHFSVRVLFRMVFLSLLHLTVANRDYNVVNICIYLYI